MSLFIGSRESDGGRVVLRTHPLAALRVRVLYCTVYRTVQYFIGTGWYEYEYCTVLSRCLKNTAVLHQ